MASGAAPVPPREEVSRDFQKSVPLAAGRSLRVEHTLGSVAIHTHARAEVDVHAAIRCSSERAADARAVCDRIQVSVEETASGVSVRADVPKTSSFSWLHTFSWSVDLDIAMPDTAPLDLRNQFGSVSVTDLHAPANIVDSNGKVSFTGGRGRQRIETSFGDVELVRNDGDVTIVDSSGRVTASDITGALDVRDNFGEIKITNIGKRLDVNAGSGNVTAVGVGGPATISDSFGKVTVQDARSDVNVRNQSGDLEITAVNGMADLRTTFGAIRFSRIGKGAIIHGESSNITGDTVDGPVTIDTTFGGIDLHGVKGGARLTAQSSTIRATDIGGEVYASTSFGGVTVEDVAQPITVENSSGSITVRAKAANQCRPISLSTTFGPIKVSLPNGQGYDVGARTSFGRISTGPPITITGQVGNESLSGKIAGGGCQLKLVDQSGDIDIRD
jgi:DUF4097 and DUF4098 domain-containing protein YvlB